jgi:ubiquinone/menaquinone biosynthesis C-methylase UbiE
VRLAVILLLSLLSFILLLLVAWLNRVRLTHLVKKKYFRGEAQRLMHLLREDQYILDVGSGTGDFAESLHGLIPGRIVCSDIQDQHLGRAPFVLATGSSLPFPDKSFDTVTMFYVLHHTDHPDDLLMEGSRVSRSKILIHEDTYKNLFEKIMFTFHVYSFRGLANLSGTSVKTDSEWKSLFAEAGLTLKYQRLLRKSGYPATRYEYLLEVLTGNIRKP